MVWSHIYSDIVDLSSWRGRRREGEGEGESEMEGGERGREGEGGIKIL
jgi:hypothetical protein